MKFFLLSLIVLTSLLYMFLFLRSLHLLNSHFKIPYDPKISGISALITSDILLLSVICLFYDFAFWWTLLLIAIIFSQFLIFSAWRTFKFLSISNVFFLFPVTLSILSILPTSLNNQYRTEVSKKLAPESPSALLTENDIVHLPLQIQKYLQFTGAIGRHKIYNFYAQMDGTLKMTPGGKWLQINAEQFNSYINLNRLFYIKSSLFGIPIDGFHLYVDNSANMKIQIAHTFNVVDAKGEKMTRSETVTLFNDMCLLAPSTLIYPSIQWEENSPTSVTAHFTNNGYTITAQLFFDTSGALTNFVSNDRYFSPDGKKYEQYQWSTPVKSYQNIEERKILSEADAVWKMPEGEFVYSRIFVNDIKYNCRVPFLN